MTTEDIEGEELPNMDTKPRIISGANTDMHGLPYLFANWLILTIAPQIDGFSYRDNSQTLIEKFKKNFKTHPYTISTDLSSMDATISQDLKEVTEHILLKRY